ncbi:hypothetical protein CHS0354_036541 [Potamilus streckersoni]|uniref:Aminotransferase class V domain-containing protein n=1 Tax=Potamilus streckersoni TaxID=2493646 RepID=A0AAE0TAF3_9BIVA|nr:hypothetical protein CHS0354_036541 [Potamilus streckersoni]
MNKSVAKRDFGSFHSSNVEELIQLSEDDYQPPKLPFKCPTFDEYRTRLPQLGNETRKLHFLLEDGCTFLNHGAFGGVLKEALTASQEAQVYAERQPLRFYDRELLPLMVHVNRRLAAFVGCSPEEVVLMTNATTALNTVIKSIPFKPGDKIFCLSVTYGAVKKILQWVCGQTGAVLQEVKVKFPIKGREEVVNYVREHLQEGTKLAVFDHIPSNTPFILPLEEIIPVCKTRNVPVLIDGAHALGVLSLDLHSLQPDYYVSNAHKWFCCPKGSAFLYVQKELKDRIRPLIVSHGFGSGFSSEFIWTGLHDYSPYLAMHVVLNFWDAVGPEKIKTYMCDLCREAGQLLCEMWGTRLAAPEDMFGSMCLIGLPSVVYSSVKEVDYSTAERIQNELYHRYNIEVRHRIVLTNFTSRPS